MYIRVKKIGRRREVEIIGYIMWEEKYFFDKRNKFKLKY